MKRSIFKQFEDNDTIRFKLQDASNAVFLSIVLTFYTKKTYVIG